MTREEYNQLAGANVSADEYETIESVYMASGDNIDKDQFCRDMKPSDITPTVIALTDMVECCMNSLKVKNDEIDELVLIIAQQADKYSPSELRDVAIAKMGEVDYLTRKIDNGKSLWHKDLQLIRRLINK